MILQVCSNPIAAITVGPGEQWSKCPGSLLYIGDSTTELFRDYNKPLKGSPLSNQYNGMSCQRFERCSGVLQMRSWLCILRWWWTHHLHQWGNMVPWPRQRDRTWTSNQQGIFFHRHSGWLENMSPGVEVVLLAISVYIYVFIYI